MEKGKILPHNHGTHTEELINGDVAFPTREHLEDTADIFSLMADASRLKIFWLLCHTEDCVANIAAAVDMSAPAVSHHLKLLKNAKLLESQKHGKEVHYKLADTFEANLMHRAIDELLDARIPGFCDIRE